MKIIYGPTLAALIFTTNAWSLCGSWASNKIGNLDVRVVSEASGLISSKLEKGKLIWNNDSGGSSALYASGSDGKIIKTVSLNGFQNIDYEAMALGPCPDRAAESCIYLGDIGDGIGWRSSFKIGIFKEADFWKSTSISPVKVIDYSYPRGDENAEGMFVTKDAKIIILSKNQSGITQVYQLETNARITQLGQIDLNTVVAQARGKGPRVTDASISPDGSKVLILTYGDIVEVNSSLVLKPQVRTAWKKGTDYNVIKGPGLPQQETITYTSDTSFIVSTEKADGNSSNILSYSCAR
jgi:hypothetical protein